MADGHDKCTNVALEGEAFARSVGKGSKLAFAIDGNTSDGDCYSSASQHKGNNGLTIGLEGAEVGVKYPIESVTVFAYDEQIRFARIWADRHLCGEIKRIGMDKYEISCGNVGASFIRIEQVRSGLRICEVQVWVKSASLPYVPVLENIALNKPSQQSDMDSEYGPNKINDGNRRKWDSRDSCSIIRETENGKWWSVDLGEATMVNSVILYAKPRFIIAARVYLVGFDEQWHLCGSVQWLPGNPPVYRISCNDREGKKVIVYGVPDRPLILCEVEVYAAFEAPSEATDE